VSWRNIILAMRYRTVPCLQAFFLPVAIAFAHHSSTMFDRDSEVTLKAMVKEFFFVNPHCSITVTVAGENGKATDWSFEAASVQGMVRAGWRKSTIKPGDSIMIVGHPLRSGEHGAQLVRVILADGTALKASEGGNY
jgi:hypothetical protein